MRRASPSASIFGGVSTIAKSGLVALLTPTSVACADSTTATRRVKGVAYSSSVAGAGRAAASRRKNSAIAAFVMPAMSALLLDDAAVIGANLDNPSDRR